MMASPCAGQRIPPNEDKLARPTQQFQFYAGAHAAAQVFLVATDSYNIQDVVVRPLYLFVGCQISPHIALQAGFLQYNPKSVTANTVVTTPAGQVISTASFYDEYSATVPILLRCRLARRPNRRLHLDGLVGATLVTHKVQSNSTSSIANQVVYLMILNYRGRGLCPTSGLGLGFDVTPHWELMAEGTANWNNVSVDRKINFGIGAGLRYRFNVGKKSEITER